MKKVEKIPNSKRSYISSYDAIIKQFLADETMINAEVSKEGIKPTSLLAGLRERISKNFQTSLRVIQRGDKVYLSKAVDRRDREMGIK